MSELDIARALMGSPSPSRRRSTLRNGIVVGTAAGRDGYYDIKLDDTEDAEWDGKFEGSAQNVVRLRSEAPLKVADKVSIARYGSAYYVYGLSGLIARIDANEQEIIDFGKAFDAKLDELKANIEDGRVDTWFGAYDPTGENEPASGWADQASHAGDVFYNTETGKMWYWAQSGASWGWEPLQDADIGQAMKDASDALTAVDGKCTIFYTKQVPAPPYSIGDLWSSGTDSTGANKGEMMIATATRRAGSGVLSDWVPVSDYSERVSKVEEELITFGDQVTDFTGRLGDLSDQLDGKVETWFYAYAPTASNQPASSWTTSALKQEHKGDLFFNTSTGYCYRWTGSSWGLITDSRITQALKDAENANDLADSKRQVFTSTPRPPYDQGDLWVTSPLGSGDLMVCKTTRRSGSYTASDWVLATDYTNDDAVVTLSDSFALEEQPFRLWYRDASSSSNSWAEADGRDERWYVFRPTDNDRAPILFWTSVILTNTSCTRPYQGDYLSTYEWRVNWPSGIGSITDGNLPELFFSASCYNNVARATAWNRSTSYLGPFVVMTSAAATFGAGMRVEILGMTRVDRG